MSFNFLNFFLHFNVKLRCENIVLMEKKAAVRTNEKIILKPFVYPQSQKEFRQKRRLSLMKNEEHFILS